LLGRNGAQEAKVGSLCFEKKEPNLHMHKRLGLHNNRVEPYSSLNGNIPFNVKFNWKIFIKNLPLLWACA
jgi:hypothetical protein